MAETNAPGAHGAEPTRRDFLYVAAAGMGAVAVGSAVWPLINQMNPSADVLALASIDLDLSAVQPGQAPLHPFGARRATAEDQGRRGQAGEGDQAGEQDGALHLGRGDRQAVFDRIFDGQDVTIIVFIDVIDHGGQRRRLA